MKYINASDILPEPLLNEVRRYADGQLLYIPSGADRRAWGERSGARADYQARNRAIRMRFADGIPAEALAGEFFLTAETIRKIAYGKETPMKKIGFPDTMPAYRITALSGPVPEVTMRRHPVYMVLPQTGSRAAFAQYALPDRKLCAVCETAVIGEAEVHGERGLRMEVRWRRGEPAEETGIDLIAQTDGRIWRTLASESRGNGVTRTHTFLEGEAFTALWGGDMPVTLKRQGRIDKTGDCVTVAEGFDGADAAGRYSVTLNGRTYETVLVINVSSLEDGIVTEEYLDPDGATILFRRFDRADGTDDAPRIFVNGAAYALTKDCIPDAVC